MKRHSESHFAAHPETGQASQSAALCWRMHRGRVQVLLITSRDTGRWILPKGWPMVGRSAAETAFIEAWEEAGVKGEADAGAEVFGLYSYDKQRLPLPPLPCMVSVFALRVRSLAQRFPERKLRSRKWFDAAKAARKVAEPELRILLSGLGVEDGRLTCALPPVAAA